MTDIRNFSANAAANSLAPPDGFPEGMAPSAVNDAARELMAAIRRQHEQAEWIDLGHSLSFVNANSFEVKGIADADIYAPTRRVRISLGATTLYGTIMTASLSASSTVVGLQLDSGALTASLSQVAVHIVSPPQAPPPHRLGDIWDVDAPEPLDDKFLMRRTAAAGTAWRPTAVTDLPECTTPDPVFDYLLGWDASAAAHRRYKLDSVGGGGGGGVYSSGNFFGNGGDGAFNSSAAETLVGVGGNDNEAVIKHYTSFTLNSGHVYTATARKKCLLIYVQQDCVINGRLHMDRKGAKAIAQDLVIKRKSQSGALLPNEVDPTVWTIAATGAAGGLGAGTGSITAGGAGIAGINGQTGGGGGGAGGGGGPGLHGPGGNGAAGSAFCGGSGGGAGGFSSAGTSGGNAAINGGSGGNAASIGADRHEVSTGGAGNPNGINTAAGSAFFTFGPSNGGGGGSLILIVGGTLTIGAGAVISADGGTSSDASGGGNWAVMTGGGAGGGSIILLHAGTLTNNGTIRAAGGNAGLATGSSNVARGGNGGAGSVIGPLRILA